MRSLMALWNRIAALWRGRAVEREMDQEFAFHVEMETRKLVASGVAADEAARMARARFGSQASARQGAREGAGTGLLYDAAADVRHALRQLRRRPGYSGLGILTLALGLGATVALGSVVRAVLLRPLPVADEAAVKVFWSDYNWRGVEYDFLAERRGAFAQLAAYSSVLTSLRTETGGIALATAVVSANLFDLLGTAPLLGRTFAPGEDRPGREPVVVLSHGLWQEQFGGDPAIVGRRVTLDGSPVTVIGVMPPEFWFPSPEYRLWRPLMLDPATGPYHTNGWLVLLGRLGAGVTAAQLDAEIVGLAAALGERFVYPAAWDKTKDPFVRPLRTYLVGDMGPGLLFLLGAGALILVMACANVAALVLARTTDRTAEIALRAALGAGRGRLARQILTESAVLSLAAGVTGAGIAAAGFRALVASLPLTGGLGQTIRLDWGAFAGGLLLALLVGLAVAAAPVRDLLAGRLQALGTPRAVRGPGRRAGRLHALLVAAEAAVAVILVVGAGLLIRSVGKLYALDLGFDPHSVTAVDLYAGSSDLDAEARHRFFAEVADRAGRLPGVRSAATITRIPVRDGGWQGPVSIEDNPDLQGLNGPNALFRPITPDYFRTMGITLRAGRGIEPTDRRGTVPVGVVSEALAQRAWPGQDPIGRRYRAGMGADPITVVGVVEDIRITSITGDNAPVHYVALAQMPQPPEGVTLLLKGGAVQLGPLRDLVRTIEPRVAIGRVTDMDEVVATALAEPLRLRFFLGLFALLALVLGVVGVYSVVSYAVARRQSEFGIRMALGAGGGTVARQVVGRGLLPVAVGTAIGVAAALLLGRLAARFLYGVSPSDPVSLASAAAALLAAGVAASLIPAWRAARVSPVEALRAE